MINVLSTGELSEDLQCHALRMGVSIDVIPFIRVKSLLNPEKAGRISSLSESKRTAIFTSKNAVLAVASVIAHAPEWKFYCIDGATCQNIIRHWGAGSIKGIAADGKELARLILKDNAQNTNSPLLFFCGSRRLKNIPEALEKAKVPFEELTVYETIKTPATVNYRYDAILFYSPSGVDSFFSENEAKDAILFSIGKTTQKALAKHNVKNKTIVLTQQADKARMIDFIINTLIKNDGTQTKE